jgi:hypothetical protein
MRPLSRGVLGAVVAAGALLVTLSASAGASVPADTSFDGAIVVSHASGKRNATGSVIAMRGVFTGVGRIVERPNKPGDSDKVSRDDLVFADGVIHIVNENKSSSLAVNKKRCSLTFRVKQTTTIDGGTGRFAAATGTFAGGVTGTGVVRRKPDGTCDMNRPMAEVDNVSATGTLTL